MKFKLRRLIKHLKNEIGEIILFTAASKGTKGARNKPSCGRVQALRVANCKMFLREADGLRCGEGMVILSTV